MGDNKEKKKGKEGKNIQAPSLVSGCHCAPVARKRGSWTGRFTQRITAHMQPAHSK